MSGRGISACKRSICAQHAWKSTANKLEHGGLERDCIARYGVLFIYLEWKRRLTSKRSIKE